MINIFGLRLLTEKDYNKIIASISDNKKEQERLTSRMMSIVEHNVSETVATRESVAEYMAFCLSRMPLKRHRKKTREYFPLK